jgi:ribosomal protein S14
MSAYFREITGGFWKYGELPKGFGLCRYEFREIRVTINGNSWKCF